MSKDWEEPENQTEAVYAMGELAKLMQWWA